MIWEVKTTTTTKIRGDIEKPESLKRGETLITKKLTNLHGNGYLQEILILECDFNYYYYYSAARSRHWGKLDECTKDPSV